MEILSCGFEKLILSQANVYFRIIANSVCQELNAKTSEVIDLTQKCQEFGDRLTESCHEDMDAILNSQVTKMETYADVSDILFRSELLQTVSTKLVEECEETLPIAKETNINDLDKLDFDELLAFLSESN